MSEVRVKRSQFATFLNTTPKGETTTYARMGKGITTASVAYNPTVNDELYISQDGANKSLDSYAPSMASEQVAFAGDPVFDFVDNLRQSRAVGDEAKTDMLMVYIYDQENEGTYRAEKQEVIVSINEFGGDAGGAVTISYDAGFCGEPVKGTVTIVDGKVTFKEATVTPPTE